jgi:aminopeptidase N
MISPGTWADLWLNEGFATWSEAFWFESYGGYNAYKSDINANANAYLSNNPGWPIYNPEWAEETPPKSVLFNGAITYAKAACILHLFRYVVGDDAFFDAIYGYATDEEDFMHQSAVTEDFIDKMSEEVGEDMSWFFEPWLEQANHPIYQNEYYFFPLENGNWEVNFRAIQVQDDGFFPMKLNIFIGFEDFSDTTVYFNNMVNDEEFKFEFEKKPVYITFDMANQIVLKQASLILSAPEGKSLNETAMLSNYPNPCGGQTTISYQLTNGGETELALYDLTGKRVRLLHEGWQSNGSHTLTVDTQHLNPGIYFYSLNTAGETATGKLVVQ